MRQPVDDRAGEEDGGEPDRERGERGDERPEAREEDDQDQREARRLAARELVLRDLLEVRPDRGLADEARACLRRRLDERVAGAGGDVDRRAGRADVRDRQERGAAAREEVRPVGAEVRVARGCRANGGEAASDGGGGAAGDEHRKGGAAELRKGIEGVADAHRGASGHLPAPAREPVGLVEREPSACEKEREPGADHDPPPPRSGVREPSEQRGHVL